MRTILLLLCILTVTVPSKAQLFRDWKSGSYYDTLNKKKNGLISWYIVNAKSPKQNFIRFKPNEHTDEAKISTQNIRAFTFGTDSFVVSKSKETHFAPVLQVLANENVKLYKLLVSNGSLRLGGGSMGFGAVPAGYGSSTNLEYYVGSNVENLTLLTKKNFIEMMSLVMANKPDIQDKIKSKILRLEDMQDLLVYYRTGKMPVPPDDDVYH
ncbi:hypothetical protein [Mucilaginibacter sp. PAMB04168]|uniref:hypothetical protein n=1 Tax=Mucilaginibacter sp. PAMB04168 TaxID=3138567 RepID=UPI0031F66AAB